MVYELQFILALGLTVATEILMGWVVKKTLPQYFRFAANGWRFTLFIAVATCLTLPYLWFVIPYFVRERNMHMLIGESLVALVEGIYYVFALKLPWRKALLFSVILNGFSFGVGLVVFR